MPHYRASRHAITRLLERFPALAPVAGQGLSAAKWLARLATHAEVAAQQAGMDLLLCIDVPLVSGPTRIYLPVTPHSGDTWIIRTVLTEEQALANLHVREDAIRLAWRASKGFTRPYVRRNRTRHTVTYAAA